MATTNSTKTLSASTLFLLEFSGASDLTEFAGLPATEINDAWYGYGSEVLGLDGDDLLEYADRMTFRTM